MIRLLFSVALLVTFAACDAAAKPASAMAGHWSQETNSAAKGMTLEFDDESDKMIVHTAPDEQGGHAHLRGTYSFDATTATVTVRCAVNGQGNGDSWSGKLEGTNLTLTAGATTLRFRRGDDPHEKK